MRTIPIGINARLFPNNWRPVLHEIAFCKTQGFRALQFPGPAAGLDHTLLGAPLAEVRAALDDAGIIPVMEMAVRVHEGADPLQTLHANLPAIHGLGIQCAHWHLTLKQYSGDAAADAYEHDITLALREAVRIAAESGFAFGIEHNEREWTPFATPQRCANALSMVDGLHFVWDLNHTEPEQLDAYLALTPRMSMLHVSDTPLPTVNHHLPLGLGNIDYACYGAHLHAAGFAGPAILEIGGLPKSGGYGRDTDDALLASLHVLRQAGWIQ
jgi:sugar phosphate isomerase/epimerase